MIDFTGSSKEALKFIRYQEFDEFTTLSQRRLRGVLVTMVTSIRFCEKKVNIGSSVSIRYFRMPLVNLLMIPSLKINYGRFNRILRQRTKDRLTQIWPENSVPNFVSGDN